MFLCDDCLKDSCGRLHISSSFGPCEGCGETKATLDCIHYKTTRPEAKSLVQVQLGMLEHLRDLARELHGGERRTSSTTVGAKLECAREMCLIAGIPEDVIRGYAERKAP